jgi:integrase
MIESDIQAVLLGKPPTVQEGWMKTLKGLVAFAREQCKKDPDTYAVFAIKTDPTKNIETDKPDKSDGYLTWGEEQIAQYRERHPIGTMARLAIELGLNIAARRNDAYQIGRQHLDKGYLRWRPSKTRKTTGKLLTIRMLPELQAALDAMPKSGELAFLLTEYGKPFKSEAGFGNKFADWCMQAKLPPVFCDDGKVRNYRFHGLRKAACVRLVHAKCTTMEFMAVSGHTSLSEAQKYITAVEQERMAEAAMDKLTADQSKHS